MSLHSSLEGTGSWTGNTHIINSIHLKDETDTLSIKNNSSGITFNVVYSIEGAGVFTFASGSTELNLVAPAMDDPIWTDDSVHTQTLYNETPFISTIYGEEKGWVAGSFDSEVDVNIDGNKMKVITKKNKTGRDRVLETTWRQWDGDYTILPPIKVIVRQKGHDS
nr:MAG: hypothetical protein [Bacteriophage sp.]